MGITSEVMLGEAAGLAIELAAEVAVESAEGLVGIGAKALLPQIVGQELEPGSLDPDVLELDVWRALTRLHEGVLRAQSGDNLFLINGAAEYCLGEIKAHVSGGGAADMSEEEVLDLVGTLIRADQAARPLDKELPEKIERLRSLQRRVAAVPRRPVAQIQEDIWIMWISSIAESDSDILDLDAIEDHLHQIGVLGPGSRLGVDFGSWTSEEDELHAIRAARAKSRQVRAEYEFAGEI